MRYPCLVPKALCKTEIHLELEREGLQENGEPLESVTYEGKCNYQDKAKTILAAEKKIVQITGTALFPEISVRSFLPFQEVRQSCLA